MRRENLNFCSAQGATDHASSLHKRNLNEAQQPVASKPPSHQSSFLVEKMGQTFEVHIFSPKEKLHVLALDAFLASCSPTLLHSLHIFAYAYSRQYASTHFSWTDFTTVGREWYPNLYTAGTRKWVFLEEEIFFLRAIIFRFQPSVYRKDYDMIVDFFRTCGWHFFRWIPLSHWTNFPVTSW